MVLLLEFMQEGVAEVHKVLELEPAGQVVEVHLQVQEILEQQILVVEAVVHKVVHRLLEVTVVQVKF
jgi:hypothetical protein